MGNTMMRVLSAVASSSVSVGRPTVTRLGLVLIAVSLRSPGGPATLAAQALAFGEGGSGAEVAVAFDLLTSLPQELAKADLSHARKQVGTRPLVGSLVALVQ